MKNGHPDSNKEKPIMLFDSFAKIGDTLLEVFFLAFTC
jgi:hypothetical protein